MILCGQIRLRYASCETADTDIPGPYASFQKFMFYSMDSMDFLSYLKFSEFFLHIRCTSLIPFPGKFISYNYTVLFHFILFFYKTFHNLYGKMKNCLL